MAATLDANPEVEVGEALASEEKNGLDGLDLQGLGLDQLNGGTCAPHTFKRKRELRGKTEREKRQKGCVQYTVGFSSHDVIVV